MVALRTDKPVIGILCNDTAPLCSRWRTPFEDREVRIIKPRMNIDASANLSGLSGFLLPGGNSNIHPSFVGRDENPHPDDHDIVRDFSAIALTKRAYDMKLPTLGICRGMQEMVAAYGGALQKLDNNNHAINYQHAGDWKKMDTPVHPIEFTPDGKLYPLFKHLCDKHRSVDVNSMHYEGITLAGWHSVQSERLRKLFQIEALSDDDVVEAISAIDRDFFIGVQAHFELAGKLHDALFSSFIKHIDAYHARTAPDALPA